MFIAMNEYEMKKYFQNLVGLAPITMKLPTSKKPLLTKGVSDKRLVKRLSK